MKQIYQVNDDGSYTFGYEADDGTYRVENRDDSGYITGKYGYLDSAGSLQEIGKFRVQLITRLFFNLLFYCFRVRSWEVRGSIDRVPSEEPLDSGN